MYATALLLGFAGSLHCLVMCSPLAMTATGFKKPFFLHRVVYNTGRILMYGVMGMLISTVASGIHLLPSYQKYLSIGLGSVLMIFGLLGISYSSAPWFGRTIGKAVNGLKKLFGILLKKKSTASVMFMGMLNGLLPCGLAYVALTYCIVLPDIADGFLFMILFGAGTLPVMLGLTSMIQPWIAKLNMNFSKITTVAMFVLGLSLITRGFYAHAHEQGSDARSQTEIPDCRTERP